jgi:hypothetical protein
MEAGLVLEQFAAGKVIAQSEDAREVMFDGWSPNTR